MSLATGEGQADRRTPRVPWPSASLIAFAGVAVIQAALILAHAPWRDETQALLIARAPLPRLFAVLHYEGHPALWYLLLAAAAKLAGGLAPLRIAQLLVAVSTQAVLWRCSPFSWRLKLLISAGYFISFEYGVIARSYGLGVLLFFAFVALRRTIWAWLILALMVNADVHLVVLAGAGAAILTLRERRWQAGGLALLAAGGVIALLTAWPARDVFPGPVLGQSLRTGLAAALSTMSAAVLPTVPGAPPVEWGWLAPPPLDRVLGVLAIFLGGFVLRRDRLLAGVYIGACLALIALSVTIYPLKVRHAGLLAVLLIGLMWIQQEDTGAEPVLAGKLWLAVLAAGGIWFAVGALLQPFCLSRPLTNWIARRQLADAPWAAATGALGGDISAAFGAPTYNLQTRCWNTYQTWNYDFGAKPAGAELARRLDRFRRSEGGGYLLADAPIAAGPLDGLRLEARFSGAMLRQELYVYRLSPSARVGPPLADCG